MPSVGLRRTTRVVGMLKSSDGARVLRSGRRLWPESIESKPKKPNNQSDEKTPKSEVNKADTEVNGKPKRLVDEENRKKQSRKVKVKAKAINNGPKVDKMFGIVYSRKRKRNEIQKRKSRMFCFVVGNGDCHGCFSNFLCLVLGYVKRKKLRLSELASFLMSRPISGVYSSNGVDFLWGPPANRIGICKFYGAREFIPLFSVDFSAVPHCFIYMHHDKLLRWNHLQLVPVNNDEIKSDSEEDEPCVTSVVDVSMSRVGSNVVEIDDNLGGKVILHPSVRASILTGRNAHYRNCLSSRGIQKKRSSLRRRSSWVVFKDLYKECSERNVPPASSVKVIPVPGVYEVSRCEDRGRVAFRRPPNSYLSFGGDEISRALAKSTANYDMDSEDEEWLKKFNNEFFSGNGYCENLSEDCFELMFDAFEKAYFCNPDDYSDENAAHLCLDLGSRAVVEAVHCYWLIKRNRRRSALLRVFQGHQVKKATLVSKPLLRKRRSFKRQASHGRCNQPTLSQALGVEHEHDFLMELNGLVKVEEVKEARISATRYFESAILKRQHAELLMQNADMAVYKAMMALRIAEAARFTEASDGAFAQFF